MVLRMITDYNNLTSSPITPKYGFKKGLHLFKEDGYKATVSELKDNLGGQGCVNMLDKYDMTSDIQKKLLVYLMFLKHKQFGKVKAYGCADGSLQRKYVSKDDSSSPTVSIYAVMTQYVMSVMEGQKVVTCDIPGEFLQSD